MKVILLEIKDPKEKIQHILKIAYEYFEKKHKLLFLVADQKAYQFVDELLWKVPEYSFLPHGENEMIAISDKRANVNHAHAIFNLTLDSIEFFEPCRIIFEFDDQTSAQKKELSQKKFQQYMAKNVAIEAHG